AVKVDDPKVSPNQLQPSVGGDVLRCKFDLQKALAWKKKIGSTQSHLEWPPLQGGSVGVATALSPATCRPFQVFSPSFFVGLGLKVVDKRFLLNSHVGNTGSNPLGPP